jgi:hypothetical protein
MKKNIPWWLLPWVRVTAGLIVLILLGGAVGGVALSQSTPEQPIQFPHSFHVGTGMDCQYCHPGVAWGPTAGLPTAQKCWGCHQQVAKTATSPELQKLAAYVKNGEEIPWVPVFIQPDFVQFNHRPHVASGVECKTCHGDMVKMTVAQPIPRQNMGWCLDCHSKQAPEKWTRLSDCATCHY